MRPLFCKPGRYHSRRLLLLAALSCLFCSRYALADEAVMTRVLRQQATPAGFDMCHGGGCAEVSHVALSAEEWQQVLAVFQPLPQTAAAERSCIAQALGVMETLVGAKTATSTDRAGTFGNSAYPGQLDCNDEAINTSNYLKMLQQAGVLRFHALIDIHRRGYFVHGWPHSTAAIQELASGERYAVDSWFYDNGAPAQVVPMELWKSGWKPADANAR